MKKINIVRKNDDFSRIIKNFKSYKSNSFIFYVEQKEPSVHKFGISVSKKIGNAVVRNKIKRQIKNILDKNVYQNNFNCIIIIRKDILKKSFIEMKQELNIIIHKLKLTKGE